MNRRTFIASTTATAAASALFSNPSAALTGEVPPPPMTTLGQTGIVTTRMAQGTGMNGSGRKSDQVRPGFEHFVKLIRHGYDRGIRFFDLADLYGTHIYFREALRYIPREEVTILTKLWFRYDDPDPRHLSPEHQRLSAKKAVERFRQEIDTEVLDVVLVHCATAADWDVQLAGYIEQLQELKAAGTIRALGVSCHSLVALELASRLEWVDITLTRINEHGKAMDGPPEVVMPVQQRFKDRGASVVGMKIFGAGQLVDRRPECMKFAQSLPYLDAMTIGATQPEQVDENLRLMARFPAA